MVLKLAFFNKGTWEAIRSLSEGEFKALSALSCSQIPRVYDTLEPEGEDWIGLTMEFIDGVPVSELHLSTTEVFQLAISLLKTLAVIQRQKLVHLDIKPANILERSPGDYVLVDFGVSKKLKGNSGDKATTILGGTPCFTDPKVLFLGQDPTLQSDLYGLGCTIAALLLHNSVEEFVQAVGMTPMSDYLKEQTPPEGVSQAVWQWLCSLVSTGKDQPKDAQQALKALEQAVKKLQTTTNESKFSFRKVLQFCVSFFVELFTDETPAKAPEVVTNVKSSKQSKKQKSKTKKKKSVSGLRKVTLPAGASHVGANFAKVDLSDQNLVGTNFRGANFLGSSLCSSNLTNCNLSGTNLANADLSDARMNGANLGGANLRKVDLRGADLSNANLSGACLQDAKIEGACFDGANMSGVGY